MPTFQCYTRAQYYILINMCRKHKHLDTPFFAALYQVRTNQQREHIELETFRRTVDMQDALGHSQLPASAASPLV